MARGHLFKRGFSLTALGVFGAVCDRCHQSAFAKREEDNVWRFYGPVFESQDACVPSERAKPGTVDFRPKIERLVDKWQASMVRNGHRPSLANYDVYGGANIRCETCRAFAYISKWGRTEGNAGSLQFPRKCPGHLVCLPEGIDDKGNPV